MSKLICDVCGTSYPETATQCPICGCAHTEATGVLLAEQGGAAASYTYVKGGRFSKANVRKRNQAMQSGAGADLPRTAEKKDSGNKWLILIAALLIAAILAVVLFIVLHLAGVGKTQPITPSMTEPSASVQTDPSTDPTTEPTTEPSTEPSNPCVGVELVKAEIALSTIGEAYQLEVMVLPVDTTDEIIFASKDESVATVDKTGKVTAVASGETYITITCGQVVKECKVTCSLEPELPVPPSFLLKLNRDDFSLFFEGDSWDLYDDDALLDASHITWTSDNPDIATVENGVVTAVGGGKTYIRAKLDDQEVVCDVYCSFSSYSGNGGVTEEGGGSTGTYQISHTDVTLLLNNESRKSFRLLLLDSNGNAVSVNWTVGNSEICSVSGNTVTALSTGFTTVRVTYGGQTYKCDVHVSE